MSAIPKISFSEAEINYIRCIKNILNMGLSDENRKKLVEEMEPDYLKTPEKVSAFKEKLKTVLKQLGE